MGCFTRDGLRKYLPHGWLPLSHGEAIDSLPQYELMGLCDADVAQLQKASEKYSIYNLSSDYRRILGKGGFDVVSVATRTDVRVKVMLCAIENGVKGLHVEKPLSQNIKDAVGLCEIISKKNIKITYGTYRRYLPAYSFAKAAVCAGEIGEIVEVNAEMGKSHLMWSHPHSIDMLIYYSNCTEVEYLQANCLFKNINGKPRLINEDPIVENATIKFTNGITGMISCGEGMNIRIFGTKGTITVVGDGAEVRIEKIGRKNPYYLSKTLIKKPSGPFSATQNAFIALYDAIMNEKPLPISLNEIIANQKILMAIPYSSLRNGSRVVLADVPHSFTVTGFNGVAVA